MQSESSCSVLQHSPHFLLRFATVPVVRRKTQGKQRQNDGHLVANNSWKEGERENDTLRGKITIYSIKPLTSTTVEKQAELLVNK